MALKRLKAIFAKPERKITTVLWDFQQLSKDLQRLSMKDPLSDIVRFFGIISKWHDRGLMDIIRAFEEVNYGQYGKVIEKLQTLQARFISAGRSKYGQNRTRHGEKVTEDKVFLGGIYNLSTYPVSFWKKRKDDKKGGWGHPSMEHLNPYDVVSRQAKEMMASHIGPIVDIIEYLKDFAVPVGDHD